jgi:hypothetical protein
VRYVLRASLVDRPGALSALTAAVSRAGGDIVALEVIDRADGVAVDDLSLTAEADATALRRAMEQVPGVIVEALREVDVLPDPGAPLALGARVAERGKGAVRTLVEGLPAALTASWSCAIGSGVGGIDLLASSGDAPALDGIEVPWLPLVAPRRLARAEWMPPAWRAEVDAGLEVAAAPLGLSAAAVLVGRRHGPRFRSSELRQLGDLARIAIATEMLVPRLTVSAGRAATAHTS